MTIEELREVHQARPFRPFTIHTADTVEQVLAFYEEKLKAEGYQVSKSTMNVQGAESANLTATAEKRTINVTLSRQEGETQGLVAFNEKP